jgi:hypothetical protein
VLHGATGQPAQLELCVRATHLTLLVCCCCCCCCLLLLQPEHITKGYVPRLACARLPGSYINHYCANGGVVVPQFGYPTGALTPARDSLWLFAMAAVVGKVRPAVCTLQPSRHSPMTSAHVDLWLLRPGLCCLLSCCCRLLLLMWLHTDQQAIDVLQKAYGPGYKVVGVPGGTREVLLNAGERGRGLQRSLLGWGLRVTCGVQQPRQLQVAAPCHNQRLEEGMWQGAPHSILSSLASTVRMPTSVLY